MSENVAEPVGPRVVEGQTNEPVMPVQEVSEAGASAPEETQAKARLDASCGAARSGSRMLGSVFVSPSGGSVSLLPTSSLATPMKATRGCWSRTSLRRTGLRQIRGPNHRIPGQGRVCRLRRPH